MRLRKQTNFNRNASNRLGIASINSRLAGNDRAPNGLLLDAAKNTTHHVCRRSTFLNKLRHRRISQDLQLILPAHLFSNPVSFSDFISGKLGHFSNQSRIVFGERPIPSVNANLSAELLDRLDDNLHFLMSEEYRT